MVLKLSLVRWVAADAVLHPKMETIGALDHVDLETGCFVEVVGIIFGLVVPARRLGIRSLLKL